MSRHARPLDLMRMAVSLSLLIERHAGKPCPTVEDIVAQTTIPHRRVWDYVKALADNGVIEVEERGPPVQRQRRLRAFCGEWTDWTERKPRSGRP